MQRRMNIQASSLIILLSVLTILVQFTAYYFIEANYIIWGAACIITIVCCHILQEETSTYEACFQYSFLTLFISLVILVVTYFGNVQDFLPYSSIMLGIAVINWFLPLLHCFIRYMLEYGTKVDDFNEFYRNTSILFLVIYLSVIFYGAFVKNSFPWAYPLTYDTYNLMPFGILSTQIEDYLYGNIPLSDIITYLLSRTLVFLPYGFYITLLLRRQARLARLCALLLLPFFIEAMQFVFLRAYCDIDDLIYAFIGGLIGSLLYYLINVIFRAITGKDFLMKETSYRFSNSNLHF